MGNTVSRRSRVPGGNSSCAVGDQSEKIAHTVNNDDRHCLSVAFLLVWWPTRAQALVG